MKRILIINGNPDKQSFCTALANAYKNGAESAGAQCKLVHLVDLTFDPILHHGYKQRTELEPDLLQTQQDIQEADHLVFVYPNWWGTYPALLKGFIDRVFLPKFSFAYRENSVFWDKLLKGKSGRLIVTMDTPKLYYSLFLGKSGHNAMKKSVLNFCGIKPVGITTLTPVKRSNENKRQQWIVKIENLGRKQK